MAKEAKGRGASKEGSGRCEFPKTLLDRGYQAENCQLFSGALGDERHSANGPPTMRVHSFAVLIQGTSGTSILWINRVEAHNPSRLLAYANVPYYHSKK